MIDIYIIAYYLNLNNIHNTIEININIINWVFIIFIFNLIKKVLKLENNFITSNFDLIILLVQYYFKNLN